MFSIAPYLVEVKDDQKQSADLWNFGAGQNFKLFLDNYYSSRLSTPTAAGPRRMFVVEKVFKGGPTSVAGVYRTGEYGYESLIYSTGKKVVTHNRQKDEADMTPFYFAFYMPQHAHAAQRKRGLMLLSRFKTFGIRQLTIPDLITAFNASHPPFTLQVSRVLPKSVLEAIMKEGALKTIRLIKRKIPKDIADVLSKGDLEQVQDVELIIRSKRKSAFSDIDWVHQILDNKKSVGSAITLDSFQPERIKLDMEINGRRRVLDLGNPGKISSNIELTDEISAGADGHPVVGEWLKHADELATHVVDSWGMGQIAWNTTV